MTQLTLTLDLTPNDVSVLCDLLPKLEMSKARTNEIVATTPAGPIETDTSSKKTTVPAAAKAKPMKLEPATSPEKKVAPDTTILSMTDVRAVALKLSKANRQDDLKEIFSKYGADKLSGVAETDYPALMSDLEAAVNE